jgi:hypothetical protein
VSLLGHPEAFVANRACEILRERADPTACEALYSYLAHRQEA